MNLTHTEQTELAVISAAVQLTLATEDKSAEALAAAFPKIYKAIAETVTPARNALPNVPLESRFVERTPLPRVGALQAEAIPAEFRK